MKDRTKFAPIALGVLLGLGFTITGSAAAHAGVEPVSIEKVQQDNVLRATLDNGLRVVIVRDTLAPMVTTNITYLTGGYETPKGFPGTAHALEHMMFRDSKGLTGNQLNQMTGKMGAQNNASTSNNVTQFYFTAPAQYTDMLLRVESIRMRGAELSSKDWAKEKGAIEQEVSRNISNPGSLAIEKVQRILYAGTGYAESALGSRPTFDKTTSAILRKFYNHWYQPNNAILVVAGDVDPQATLAKVKELFGPIKRGTLPARVPLKLEPFKPQTITQSTADSTGEVQYFYRVPGQRSKDYAAMQVLMEVLGNARSPLSELTAQGKVLSADAGAQDSWYGGIAAIEAGFPMGGDSAKTATVLNGVIEDLLKNGVSADLVEAARRQRRAEFEFGKNSASNLASRWSQALADRGLNSPEEGLDQFLAVTPQDVDRVAREFLKPDQRVTVVLTPDPNGKRPPDSKGFGGTESFAGNDKLDVPLPAWAAQQLAKLEMPHWTLDPVRMTLTNGITLIVQPETNSHTVIVVGHVDSNENMQAPEGQEGVGQLLETLFDYGSTTLDRSAFHKALDEIASSVRGGTDFSLSVPSEHFDKGMQLLADNQLRPALPQSAFTVQQKTSADGLAGELQSPDYKAGRAAYESLLPAGDSELRQATPATVNKLTLEDVKRYFAQVYRPDMTTIVVVGDVTPAQAKAAVEKSFGAWTAIGPKPDVIPKPVPLNPPGYTVVPNPYASQDSVVRLQNLALTLHDPDRYALNLGNDVLGGHGFSSRLMVDVRVNHGFAYGIGSHVSLDRSRSMFYVQYASDPDKVKAVDGLVDKNLMAMREIPVTPGELMNAKLAEIRAIPLQVSSYDEIARMLSYLSSNGEPLDEPMVAAKNYLALTAEQVRDAFKKYIQPDHMAQVVEGPDPKKH